MEAVEGRLAIDEAGNELYYRRYGRDGDALVGLHGGPGGSHPYMLPLGGLADESLQVLLYDQLGGGRSDRPDDDARWTVEYFVDELERVREAFGFERMHLYGQSWGGVLALEYALARPERAASLILSNTGASVPEIVRGMARLRAELEPEVFAHLLRCEAVGDFESPEYKDAVNQLYVRHFRRPTPFDVERGLRELEEVVKPVTGEPGRPYFVMWGPNEFACTGSLLTWDVTDRLGEIEAPTLILCGWYDEITIGPHRTLAERIPDNEFVIFGNSSHVILLEKEADVYLDVVRGFLDRVRHR